MNINEKEMIKKIIPTNMLNKNKDVGFINIFKDEYLKKRKGTLKKFAFVVFGNTPYELKKNLKRMTDELDVRELSNVGI